VTQAAKAQIINPPNTLRLKVGGRLGGIDPAAIAKAEAALKSLSDQFGQWLQDELVKLDAARAAVREQGYTTETAETLYLRAHDLKGLGATYGFPIVTRIAGSLCKMTDDAAIRLQAPLALIDAHVEAIKAAVRDDVREADDPTAGALVSELERRVAEHMASLGR
jgi:hypothetical protein